MNNLTVDTYALMVRCIEEGVSYGWMRAHKHIETPDPATIQAAIEDAVMNAIAEYFRFEETNQ